MATDQVPAPSSDLNLKQKTAKGNAGTSKQSRSSSARTAKPVAGPAKPQTAQPARKSVMEEVLPERRSLREYLSSREGRLAFLTYFISIALHGIILFGLALVILQPELADNLLEIVSAPVDEPIEEPEEVFDTMEQPDKIYNQEFQDEPDVAVMQDLVEETQPISIDINDFEPAIEIEEESLESLAELAKEGEFGGRSAKGRKALVKSQGGSEGSEAAVVRALKWIAQQQLPNGSWDFAQIGESPDAGKLAKCQMGATGLALMAFLGAGHTHMKEGPYKKHVEKGLAYIMNNAKILPTGVDYREPSDQGNMYVQGICTIALAEAYGMTKDRRLQRPAEGGLAFIINAQDARGGGWRYKPGQQGDTSVVGWQIMALVSGHNAKMPVPRGVFSGCTSFLNHVQLSTDQYTYYGYMEPQKRASTSAVGLLCRMYLGWDEKTAGLKKGVQLLADTGPSKNDEYYNYYATQVMHHWGGEAWTAWNNVMREQLIDTQVKEGVASGTWKPIGGHGAAAGRLYTTCLNVMTLEVYYRHLPLYQRNAVKGDF